MASWVAALFFLRFRRDSGDRLFGFFAAAFALLGVEYVILIAEGPVEKAPPEIFLLRLVAFVLILVGVVDKNRRPG